MISMPKTSFDIPEQLLDDVKALANKRQSTPSQIFRQAIQEHIDRAKETGELKKKAGRSKPKEDGEGEEQ